MRSFVLVSVVAGGALFFRFFAANDVYDLSLAIQPSERSKKQNESAITMMLQELEEQLSSALSENNQLRQNITTAAAEAAKNNRITGNGDNNKTSKNNVIYGHVHMAKTGGSSINGRLALNFERVCGNKGYSFKAYQANKEVKDASNPDTMESWGFEDCDYISVETGYSIWSTWDKFWKPYSEYFHSFNLTLELHVPCRDPLEHFMSMCNMKHRSFDCSDENLEAQFSRCANAEWQDRFSIEMAKLPHTSLKCFNPIPVEPYLDYMAGFLQRKRLTHDYIFKSMNTRRVRSKECIWQNATLQKRVLEMMREKEYYKFCESCLGSENDLLVGKQNSTN